MKKVIGLLVFLSSVLLTLTPVLAAEPTSVYELRIYTTHPGKMPDLLARFKNHTCQIFERHGMVNVGYWV
ncbi:MAG: NIPSNAP family protein, partial [Moraxellaceae bacterium]